MLMIKIAARFVLAAIAGALIAWVSVALGIYAFSAWEHKQGVIIEWPLWAFWLLGGSGASVGLLATVLAGKMQLPGWVRPAVFGSLTGVATVVGLTLWIASWKGGSFSHGRTPYLEFGLVYGVPVGLVGGGLVGILLHRRANRH
jgi:hypothetical protein